MDILAFALDQERQLETYYQQLMAISPHPAIRTVFKKLSYDEQLHVLIMERLQDQRPIKVVNSNLKDRARSELKCAEQDLGEWGMDQSELDLFDRAKSVELQKERFYQDRAQESISPRQREIYQKLAQQEHMHYRVMEQVCDLLARSTTYVAKSNHISLVNTQAC